MKKNIISWVAQVIVVVILGQTLYFKFTDAPDTVALFAKLGMGPVGYKLTAFIELIACLLLLSPKAVIWGSILSWGVMSGAIIGHITKIGFEGPDGVLGGMAILAWLLSALIIFLRKNQVSFVSNMFGAKGK